AELKYFQSVVKATEQDLGDEGRVLVRYSGTESKLRLLVEGKDDLQVAKAIKAIEIAASKELDVIHS
ncbi:MAG: phosphoglucosamine mutase, partial [Verrucomicrobiota bacterium]|nr:phosphoglucosamine mutase [Verrucomicrobiota bacterium]